jgi:hypothetical protein
MSDELLIDRIRQAMQDETAELRPRSETLQQALASAPRRSLSLNWLMPAMAVGVATLVAVVAVTSLSHRAPATRAVPSGVPVRARGLASRLAVLRRSQRPADVLPAWAVRETESLTLNTPLIGRLSRRVATVHLGQYGRASVYLVVHRPPRFPLHLKRLGPPQLSPRLGDQATIAFVGPFREEAAINDRAVAAGGETVAAHGGELTAGPGQFSELWGAVASIVPDGVKRVKWVFVPVGIDSGLPPITVWPKVGDNVAIGHVRPRLQFYLRAAVWYGADGRELQWFGAMTSAPPSAQKFKQALEMSLHDPVAPALLRHFGVLGKPSHSPGLSRTAAASLIEPNPVDLNVARARSVFDRAMRTRLWVIPGTQGMAIRSEGAVVGQGSGGVSVPLSGGLFIESARRSGHRTIIGLAPDGNRVVTALLPSGHRRTAPVKDNFYVIVVPVGTRTLLVRNAAGRMVRVPL